MKGDDYDTEMAAFRTNSSSNRVYNFVRNIYCRCSVNILIITDLGEAPIQAP